MRRREAEQLLHGFRGFYGESFASWSPRHAKKGSEGRFSFGAEDSLRDPNDDSRRESYLSEMGSDWGGQEERDDSSRYARRFIPQPLDPSRGDFLMDDRHYDGTGYERSQQDMEVSSGVEMFSPSPQTLSRFMKPPLSARSGRSWASGQKAPEFFQSPKSTSGGNMESDVNEPTAGESNEFVDDSEENEFRENPPSTARSSASDGKAFFTSPRNAGGFSSPYEPRRMKLYTPTSAASNGDFGPEGYPEGYEEKLARHLQRIGDEEGDFDDKSERSSSYRYEPPKMKIYTPTGASSHSRTPISDSRQSYDPTGATSETFERTSEEGSTKMSEERIKGNAGSFESEDSAPSASAVACVDQGFRIRKVGGKTVEGALDDFRESAEYTGSDHRGESFEGATGVFREPVEFDESDHTRKPRKSEDPDGREPESYPERRLKLQINEEDTPENKLRNNGDEGVIGAWRGRGEGIESVLSVLSEDSTIVSARYDKSVPKAAESAVTEAPKEEPIEEEPIKVEPMQEEPVKVEPIQEEPIKEEPKKSPVPLTVWRDFISDEPGAKFPPEAGRYHLYASYACPGSHRSLIVRALKGLEDVVSVTIVHPTWRHTNPEDPKDKHRGWIFGDPDGKPFHNTMGRGGPFPAAYPGNDPDPVLNARSVRNLYEHAKDTSGKYTIPLLWDTKLNTIVNNESSDIAYMLNSSFNKFAKNPELDLYTEDDDEGLDRLNEVSQWLYPMMIHGVYRCGFAKTQRAYDRAIDELTAAFDAADALLQEQRYLTGDTLTDADIRFFVTLIRFDEVYAFYFRANTRLVLMTPSLLNFCREIYQMPGVAETCQMDQIKAHFFGSHAEWNKYSVVPRGLDFMRYLDMPHDRDKFDSLGEF